MQRRDVEVDSEHGDLLVDVVVQLLRFDFCPFTPVFNSMTRVGSGGATFSAELVGTALSSEIVA